LQALQNWQDNFSIGNVYLRYAEDLLKAYPPFINFFEASKEMLAECDKTNPRFHAFLKVCQSKQVRGCDLNRFLLISDEFIRISIFRIQISSSNVEFDLIDQIRPF